MVNKVAYEEKILYEVRTLPEEALPKVLKLLSLIKDEFVVQEVYSEIVGDDNDIKIWSKKFL